MRRLAPFLIITLLAALILVNFRSGRRIWARGQFALEQTPSCVQGGRPLAELALAPEDEAALFSLGRASTLQLEDWGCVQTGRIYPVHGKQVLVEKIESVPFKKLSAEERERVIRATGLNKFKRNRLHVLRLSLSAK